MVLLVISTCGIEIEEDVQLFVRTDEDIKHLLSCPERLRFDDSWRRQLELSVAFEHAHAYCGEGLPVVEHIQTTQ